MISSVNASYMPLSSLPPISSLGSRTGVPVVKSQALYANFKHFYGVPTEDGIRIDRLQVLNAVIDRLSDLRRDPRLSALARRDSRGADPAGLDDLILRLEKDMRAEAMKPAAPYRPSVALPTAIAVNLLA